MGHFAGTTFGTGFPIANPVGFSPYTFQGFGTQPMLQPYGQSISNPLVGGSGITAGPLQYVAQLLQIVPQQLQQVQALQQQQLLYIQQLLQIVPAQLQQLQQLIQIVPQQIQQLQQQPFGAGIASPFALGVGPQAFGAQSAGHVM
jgi:hypothetical protein